jgi:hypothetical protein
MWEENQMVMPDREKVIKGLGIVSRMLNEIGRRNEMDIVDDAISLLKEQQQQIWEFQDQVEYLTDKQKEQKFLVDSDGKITPLPVVVRCKDCRFRGNTSICPLAYIEKTEQFTALCVDEWFCGNGKRKEGR